MSFSLKYGIKGGVLLKKAVFLDRDGVINDNSRPVNHYSQFHFIEGALDGIKQLAEKGYEIFVVTNQGGVGLGYMKKKALDEIHHHMVTIVKENGGQITEVKACTHRPNMGCHCRKPEPGMILDLGEKHHINLKKSYMIGDFYTDILAGMKAGVKTIYIGKEDLRGKAPQPDYFACSLLDAIKSVE